MENIILNELNRQIALRVKEKIDNMMRVHAYLSKEDIIKIINNILNNISNDFDKEDMLKSIIVNQFIVNKDRVSKEIFEEMEGCV